MILSQSGDSDFFRHRHSLKRLPLLCPVNSSFPATETSISFFPSREVKELSPFSHFKGETKRGMGEIGIAEPSDCPVFRFPDSDLFLCCDSKKSDNACAACFCCSGVCLFSPNFWINIRTCSDRESGSGYLLRKSR